MPKNILYFIPNISRNQGGIFQYSMRVLESLRELDYRIIVYTNSEQEYLEELYGKAENIIIPMVGQAGIVRKLKDKLKRISNLLHTEIKLFPKFSVSTLPGELTRKFDIDLVHSPTQGYPTSEIPFIFTLHDVQEIHLPQYFSPKERENRARNNRIGCEGAVRIIVSYTHVKQDLIELFKVPADKIDVVFIGTSDKSLLPRENTLEIKSDFLLYPAATWPHKNHMNLLKAFAMAKQSHPELSDLKLVCTGHVNEHFEEIKKAITANGLGGSVEFRGLVSDKELKDLYATTRAVIVPTTYEAGSFPLMESIVQHIPVVCSNVTSLPEAIDNDEFTFAPDDLNQMSECIYRISSDSEYRKRNVINSERLQSRLIEVDISENLRRVYSKIG